MNMSAIPAPMVISTEAGAQGQATGQGAASGNSGFAGVLTQVGSATPSTVSATATTGSNIGLLNLPHWQMPLTEGEVGGLLQLLVQQMRYSDKDAADLAPAEEAQYEAVMEQIQALLIAMGMMSPAQTGTSGVATQSPDAADALGQTATEALPTDRHQAVLKAVAALLDQGDPATRQWFRTAVEPQLTKLQELLSRPIQVAPSQDTSEVPIEQKSQQASLQPTSVIHAGSHLQRLNQWSAPAAALAASQQAEAAPAEEQTELTAKADNGHAMTATLQDQVRWQPQQLRPLVAQPVPVAQFADTMSGMVMKQFDVTTVNGISEARISLFPEHLGQVDVKITIVGGQLTAMFTAENGIARELLENSMHQLRGALQQQGLQVERLQVTQSEQPQQQTFQEQRQPGSGQQHASSEQHKSPRASAAEDSFEEELSHEAVRQELDYGSAINVTA
ncbi:flagellar hook-length control protein FliK [Paenibacillus sp. 598K]|uniref:flagellar hook-length control protein FliK n=1 Tax=Paenibacillus sp. 598K TaxID=1117987 RepID=UPI000FFA1DD4|nr:flagellar hook-length control protein FliK [Paenibacillus sp. 598K]GBF72002.1 flagellar hook-length control protein FliK [Paenibacillus sp. 598K]